MPPSNFFFFDGDSGAGNFSGVLGDCDSKNAASLEVVPFLAGLFGLLGSPLVVVSFFIFPSQKSFLSLTSAALDLGESDTLDPLCRKEPAGLPLALLLVVPMEPL